METDIVWAERVGCSDEQSGKIGLFSLLRLISDFGGIGLGYVCVFEGSSVLNALHEADPQQRHWHIEPTTNKGLVKVWRRKEWNESYEKQQKDAVKKVEIIANEEEFQRAKGALMEFLIVAADGNRRHAERLFGPYANDRQRLLTMYAKIKKATNEN